MGVMRHGEALDAQIAEFEGGARIENLPVGLVLQFRLNGLGRHHVGEDDGVELLGEGGNPCRMVSVLVGDENRVDLLWLDSTLLEHAADALAAKTRVHEDLAVFRDQESAVAGTATAEDRELHGHRETQWRRDAAELKCEMGRGTKIV